MWIPLQPKWMTEKSLRDDAAVSVALFLIFDDLIRGPFACSVHRRTSAPTAPLFCASPRWWSAIQSAEVKQAALELRGISPMGGGGGGAGGAIPAMGGAGGGRGGGGGGGGGAPGGAGMVGTERRTHVSDHVLAASYTLITWHHINLLKNPPGPEECSDFSRTWTHSFAVWIECFHGDQLAHHREREREGVLRKVLCCRPDPGAEVKQLLRQPTMLQT